MAFSYGETQLDPHVLLVRIPRGLKNKRGLMDALRRQLRLPGYFGGNWDALEECLRDLSWLPTGQRVVLMHDAVPLRAGRDNRRAYLQLLEDLVHDRSTGRPLQVIFPANAQAVVEADLVRR